MPKALFFFLLFFSLSGGAQHKVTFNLTTLPAYHSFSDTVYLAGTFNNWNPEASQWRFVKKDKAYQFETILPQGRHEFKVTRGGWARAESGNAAVSTTNRIIDLQSDTTLFLSVAHWADHFPKTPIRSTANSRVKVMDSAFYIPQLNRYRRVLVYLPEGYAENRKRYPVLYLHDGQNVFDAATSFSGEWGVDEAMDTLGKLWGQSIVVAIDNNPEKRLNEYSPYDMEKYGKGEGQQYANFIATTLRRHVDKHYRTIRSRKQRFIAGSSMGGLISFYTLLEYPKVFGGAGVFSPAFWIVPQLKDVIPNKAKRVKGNVYFFAGKFESTSMVPDMLAVFETMRRYSKATMKVVIRTEGKHTEATWREEFPLFYQWIMPPVPRWGN